MGFLIRIILGKVLLLRLPRQLGLRTVRITVTAVQFTVYTGQLLNVDGTVRDYSTEIRPYLRVNYHSLKVSLPQPLTCSCGQCCAWRIRVLMFVAKLYHMPSFASHLVLKISL